MEAALELIGERESAWGLLLLALGAGLEYVFPPFPGDTLALLGGVLVGAKGWSVTGVMLSVTLGSVFGSLLDYGAGRWIAQNPESRLARWLSAPGRGEKVARALELMERRGAVFLCVNRFVPGIRAFFFVCAGMARLSVWQVALWGAISAALWNGLILAAGWWLGGNLEGLQRLFERYTTGVWVVGAVAVIGWLLWRAWRRRKNDDEASKGSPRSDADDAGGGGGVSG